MQRHIHIMDLGTKKRVPGRHPFLIGYDVNLMVLRTGNLFAEDEQRELHQKE